MQEVCINRWYIPPLSEQKRIVAKIEELLPIISSICEKVNTMKLGEQVAKESSEKYSNLGELIENENHST